MKHSFLNATGKRAGIVLVLAMVLLVGLTASVWATWGSNFRQGLFVGLQASLTATPTRTPRPETPEPQHVPVELVIVAPAATPLPEVIPAAPPAEEITPSPMPPLLSQIAREYGIDISRRFVIVDVTDQRMYAWDPGKPVREMPVSTGDTTRGYRTPAWYGLVGEYWGTFQTRGVYADEGWYLYQDAGDILVHSAPYKRVNGEKVYQEMDALGNYPASRGCIRLAPEDAQWFTDWHPKGVPFVVLPRNEG